MTRHPQPGNDRPRLFRLPDSRAVVNRMGFNNAGAQALAARLAALGPLRVPLGISLGKSKVTPLDEAVGRLRLPRCGRCTRTATTSPSTSPRPTRPACAPCRTGVTSTRCSPPLRAARAAKPLLVKVAPDLTDAALGEVLEVCDEHGVDGLIATNTTLGPGRGGTRRRGPGGRDRRAERGAADRTGP